MEYAFCVCVCVCGKAVRYFKLNGEREMIT